MPSHRRRHPTPLSRTLKDKGSRYKRNQRQYSGKKSLEVGCTLPTMLISSNLPIKPCRKNIYNCVMYKKCTAFNEPVKGEIAWVESNSWSVDSIQYMAPIYSNWILLIKSSIDICLPRNDGTLRIRPCF